MNKLNSILIFGLFLGLIAQANCADRNSWGTGDLWKDWERASCYQKLQIGLTMLTGCEFFLPGRSDWTPETSPQGSPTAVTDPIFARKPDGLRPFAKSVDNFLMNSEKKPAAARKPEGLSQARRDELLRPRHAIPTSK